jgi:cysteine-rich repeat protein
MVIVGTTLILVSATWADVPPPPANQFIGVLDTTFDGLTEADCRACHDAGVPDRHHLLDGESIPPGSIIPYPDADGNGSPDTTYSCASCHGEDDPPADTVVRDCTACHTVTPHHATADALSGDCVSCHGDLVDNMSDGHTIPTYPTSLVTPAAKGGTGLPLNSRGNGAGACDYCHDEDALVPAFIRDNATLHHATGLSNCSWCHDITRPKAEWIRVCEGCHGPDSLHNIQVDSNGDGVKASEEDPGYGHIGDSTDCWGCHGFAVPAPGCGNTIVEGTEECDDGNLADGDCCSATCTFEADGSSCSDGQFCNGGETCDGSGTCEAGVPVDCGDGVDCTNDSCDETNDVCVNAPDNGNCADDGLFCNGQNICDPVAGCVSTGDPCLPAEVCYEAGDACIPSTGKVTICHIPPGNPSKAKTKSIGAGPMAQSVLDHLAHGDTLGPCPG